MNDPLRASEWLARGLAREGLGVEGATLLRLHAVREARGFLTVGESGRELPFVPKRFFVISGVPREDIRGEHAHRTLQQLLACLAGSVVVDVDDARTRRTVILDSPEAALHLAPMTWASQHQYTVDAVLLVLASEAYDPADYIREYGDYAARRRRA